MRKFIGFLVALGLAFGGMVVGTSAEAHADTVCNDKRPWHPVGRRINLDGPESLYVINPVLRCDSEASRVRIGPHEAIDLPGGLWYAVVPDSTRNRMHVVAHASDGRHSGWVNFKE